MTQRNGRFDRLAQWASHQAGQPWACALALATVLVWSVSGPIFGYSDTWQLVINTGTTIVTFLMVFLIQHAQNRDTQAIQVKLDELIRATTGAQNRLIALEEKGEEALVRARSELRGGEAEDAPETAPRLAVAMAKA